MIQVPSTWKCSTAQCVCVEVEDTWWLCHVVALPYTTVRYNLEPCAHIAADRVAPFLRDNTGFTEVKSVHWLGNCGDGHFQFSLAEDAAHGVSVRATQMSLHALRPVYHTSAVTLCGDCTCGTRAALGFLSATLSGRFVCVGAVVETVRGTFTVQDMTLRDGYRGVALVGTESRIRLNVPTRTTSIPAEATECPVGLEDAVRRLRLITDLAASCPGHVRGVVVRGPPGCGVRTAVNHCLSQCIAAGGVVHEWSPSAALEVAASARVNVLLVTEASQYFSTDEPYTAKLAVRRLMSDALRLAYARNGLHPSAVVIAVSHDYGTLCDKSIMESFFTDHVAISLPDVEQRAAIFASQRGGSSADWLQEAQTLVGRTRRDVLAAASTRTWKYTPPFKTVHWNEIGGITAVKDRLYRALVWPQQHPEQLQRFGITPPKGILLYGPPGCAKTTLVKALCSEGQFAFIYLDSASVLSAFVGDSEQLLRDVFTRAAQQAPCIVFFDEVEVIGGRRAAGRHDAEQTRLLSTLLTEMDGFSASKGVCFIGATNVPHMIDDALLRPGRFDFLVHVPLPTLADRRSILALHLDHTTADLDALAGATEGFSGADIKSLCSSALLRLLRHEDSAPETLQCAEQMTAYLLQQAAEFPRTGYDMSQIVDFHERHSAN